MNNEYIPVYKLGYMEELVRKGYHIKSVVDNKRDSSVKVFMFYKKDGIEEELDKLREGSNINPTNL